MIPECSKISSCFASGSNTTLKVKGFNFPALLLVVFCSSTWNEREVKVIFHFKLWWGYYKLNLYRIKNVFQEYPSNFCSFSSIDLYVVLINYKVINIRSRLCMTFTWNMILTQGNVVLKSICSTFVYVCSVTLIQNMPRSFLFINLSWKQWCALIISFKQSHHYHKNLFVHNWMTTAFLKAH